MTKYLKLIGELMYFFFLSVPLALVIFIGLHIGLFIYITYREIKSLCQRIIIR